MPRPVRMLLECSAFAAFAVLLGYFSTSPAYQYFDPHRAELKLSFRHTSEHAEECRRLSPEEIAALAPNMRRPMQCSRARVPILVELRLDDERLYRAEVEPSGIAADGACSVYERFAIAPGQHHLQVRMRDTRADEGFNHVFDRDIEVAPLEIVVVDFREELDDFLILE